MSHGQWWFVAVIDLPNAKAAAPAMMPHRREALMSVVVCRRRHSFMFVTGPKDRFEVPTHFNARRLLASGEALQQFDRLAANER